MNHRCLVYLTISCFWCHYFCIHRFLKSHEILNWQTEWVVVLTSSKSVIPVFTTHCLIIRCCVIIISILLQFTTLFACYRVLCPSYKDCCLHFLSSFWSVHWGLKVFVQLWFKDSTVSSSLISTIFLVQWCSIIHFVKRNPRPAFCHSVEELFSAAATGNSIVSFTYHQRFLQMHWFLNNRDSSRDSSDALLFSSRLGRAGKYCNQVQVSRSDEFLWNEDVLERARQVF